MPTFKQYAFFQHAAAMLPNVPYVGKLDDDTAANLPWYPSVIQRRDTAVWTCRAHSPPPYAAGIHTALRIHTHRTGKHPALTEIS